jgi:hypothetical protein
MDRQALNRRNLTVIACVFLIVGPSMLAIAGYLAWGIKRFLDGSVAAQGTVTGLVPVASASRSKNSSPKTSYAGAFSFTAADGMSYSVTSSTSSNPPEFKVGEAVAVRYDPRYPSQARIDSVRQVWGAPLVVGGMGTVFLAMAFVVILRLRSLAAPIG